MGDELQRPDVVAWDADAWISCAVRLLHLVSSEELGIIHVNPSSRGSVVVGLGLRDFWLGKEEGDMTACYQIRLFLFACVVNNSNDIAGRVRL